jgi:O-antigen/teichoic acid export membrane protein
VNRIRRNLLANFASQALVPLSLLVALPFYRAMMGLEAVGLVTFFAVLRSLANPLDAGLSVTLNRELARSSARPGNSQTMRDLLRSTEVIFWFLAAGLGIGVVLGADPIARYWLNPESLSQSALRTSLMVMGVALMLQWPFALYRGGLVGMQRQVSLAKVQILGALVGYLGVIPFMAWTRSDAATFFAYQAGVHLLQTLAARTLLKRSLPPSAHQGRFRWKLLRESSGFALGLTWITLTGLIITQADKVYLSKILHLDGFADYSIAAMGALALGKLFAPVFQAVGPRLTQLAHTPESREKMQRLYHQGCQLVAVLLLPACAVAAVFSHPLLTLWLGARQAGRIHGVFSILALSMGLNGLMMIPYALQLAHGWTRLLLGVNLLAIPVEAGALVVLTGWLGLEGAALAWLLPQALYILVMVPLMHRKLLKGQLCRWWTRDLLAPLVPVTALVAVSRLICLGINAGTGGTIALAVTAWLASGLGALLWADQLRPILLRWLPKR